MCQFSDVNFCKGWEIFVSIVYMELIFWTSWLLAVISHGMML